MTGFHQIDVYFCTHLSACALVSRQICQQYIILYGGQGISIDVDSAQGLSKGKNVFHNVHLKNYSRRQKFPLRPINYLLFSFQISEYPKKHVSTEICLIQTIDI